METVQPAVANPVRQTESRDLWLLALMAFGVSWVAFLIGGDIGVNLSDEGYLWYGTRALKQGLVPIRDFQAYDPGRYVWTTAWSFLFGDGLVTMRAGCVLFQCFGVLAGLLVVRRLTKNWAVLLVTTLTLVQWMNPRYKVFEQSIALMAVYAAVLLLEKPTLRRHLLLGAFVGVMAFMGRNHGLYQLGAFGLVILVAWRGNDWRQLLKRLAVWGGGIGIGYLPQLLMFAFVPGYFEAFLALLDRNVSIGSNVGIPVPWPWLRPANYGGYYAVDWWAQGLFYLALPVFLSFALIRIARLGRVNAPRDVVFVAASCVTLTYAHHAFSRADWVHLAHSVPTLIVGVLAAAWSVDGHRWLRPVSAAVLLVGSFAALFLHTGVFSEFVATSITNKPPFMERAVAGQAMSMPLSTARLLAVVDKINTDYAKPEEPILFVPNLPGLYPFTNRLSPVKHLYFTRPTPGLDEATIAQMESAQVKWIFLRDYALDKRDDLRFRNTDPVLYRYFNANFSVVNIAELPPSIVLMKRNAESSRQP